MQLEQAVSLHVWQNDINTLKLEHSYHLEGLTVRSFDGKKYLTPPKSGFTVTPLKDIGAVEEPPEITKPEPVDATVVGVLFIANTKACITCKGKIQEITPQIGRCTKCNMMQRLERCTKQLYAKLLVSVGQHDHQLHAYLPMIKLITKDDTITDDTHTDEVTTQLLLSDPFQTTWTPSHVINSVSHKTSQD